MVDANGGYTTKQALRVAQQAAPSDVIWFEEPPRSESPSSPTHRAS
jgi:L-alanine-DL-glutamate epimerase-like enolase superfamily enzyme